MNPAQFLAAGRRNRLFLFVQKVFEFLHPGEPPLERDWYLEAMAHVMQEMVAGRRPRQVISVPPRHLKSIMACVALPAWALGRDPSAKFMIVTYSEALSLEHAAKFRIVMESEWYQALFPYTCASVRGNRQFEWRSTKGGYRKAVSVGGSITGLGADFIIMDDCAKADDAESPNARETLKTWFSNTLMTRLNNAGEGRVLSIQQRLHEEDLSGHMLELGFAHLNLPSIAEVDETIPLGGGRVHTRKIGDLLDPRRFGPEVIDQLRRTLGPAVFSAQYQQNPVAPGGNLINLDWFEIYDGHSPRSYFHTVIQSWDTGMSGAPTADYSVGMTWGFRENNWFLLDIFRERLDYPDLKRAVIRKYKEWTPDKLLVEDAGAGKSLVQDLRINGFSNLRLWRVTGGKEERFVGTFGEIETGHFLLPAEAPWLEAFKAELRAFPKGRHDDQVDAFSQFVEFQKWMWGYILEVPDERGRRIRPRFDKRPW